MIRSTAVWLRSHPLVIVLALGLALRLIKIQTRDIWYDDAFSIFLAQRSFPEIVAGTAADTMPPLYYFILHYWMLLSHQLWFLRLLSVILSLLSIAVFYVLVENWSGWLVAGWAAFFAAISPLMIYHAQEMRMYGLLAFGQVCYLLFFTLLWKNHNKGRRALLYWAGLIFSGAVTMYTHNIAIFTLVVPDFFLLLRREWKRLFRLILAQAVIGVIALSWLLLIPGQIARAETAWPMDKPGLIEIVQAIIMFVAALPLPTPMLALALLLSMQIFLVLVLGIIRGRIELQGLSFWLVLVLLPPLLMLALSYFLLPVFTPRGLISSSLAYEALAGLVITRTWSRGTGKVLAGTVIIAALVSLPYYYSYSEFPRSPYRQAASYLSDINSSGDVIVHETKLSYFPARYYAPELPQVFLADAPDSRNNTLEPASQQAMQIFPQPDLPSAVDGYQRVYFVTYSQIFEEYESLGAAEHPHLAWLAEHYRPAGHTTFNDLEVFLFER